MRNKGGIMAFLCLLILLTLAMPLTASASGSVIIVSDGPDGSVSQADGGDTTPPTPEPPKEGKYIITIAAPRGWYTKSATATVKLEDVNGTGFGKTEVRHGSDGKWQDISDALRAYGSASVELSDNGTLYVAVTDLTGKAHMRSLYIECFDREAPTVKAKIEGRTLRIEADDSHSGIAAVYVNGYEFDDLTNGTLDIRVKDYVEKDEEYIYVQAVDYAGNKSKTVQVKNPYYEADTGKAASSAPSESASSSQAASSQAAPAQTAPAASAPAASSSSASSSASQTQSASSKAEQPAASGDSGSVTPTDGTGSVIENSVKTPDQREFFTITTERGNDYYIVVDKEKSDKNVYLLSEVTEEDLVGLTKQSEPSASEEPVITPPVLTPSPDPEPEQPTESEPEAEPTPEPKTASNTGTVVIMIVAVVAFGGAAYYFKIVRPKRDAADPEEDEDEDADGSGYPDDEYGGDGYEQGENEGEV